MESLLICQSCSMPLNKKEDFGTDSDGGENKDYCIYCYKEGKFTNDMTLDETIADSINYAKMAGMTEDEMLNHAKNVLPTLKRWKNH